MAIHSFSSRVFWSDTDAARIAHFSSFFRFCEMTEEDFFNTVLGWRWRPDSVMFPRVRAECSYYKPLFVHDDFRVDIVDVVIGRKSITYRFEVYNESRGYKSADCTIVTVAVSPDTMEAIEVPGDVRDKLLRAGARLREA